MEVEHASLGWLHLRQWGQLVNEENCNKAKINVFDVFGFIGFQYKLACNNKQNMQHTCNFRQISWVSDG